MPLASRRPGLPPAADPTRRRLLTALLAAPLTAGTLAGCTDEAAAPTGDRVELSVFWWGDRRRAELTEQALRLYSARHPGLGFRFTWQEYPGYYERLATQAAGGNAPDLFQIDDTRLTEYAQREILLDLTADVRDNRLDLRGLPQSLVQYGQVDGRTMAVAAAADTPALIINRSLLRRLKVPDPTVGMSYPQLIDWAATVTRRSGGKAAGVTDAAGDQKALWLWLRGRSQEFYRGRQLGFVAADLAEWFDLWQGARARKATPGVAVVQRITGGELDHRPLLTGQAAASFVWSEQLPGLQAQTADELDLVGAPGDPAAHWARASMYWAGFRGTRHRQAVVDVINFLTNDAEVARILGVERGVGANLNHRRAVQDAATDPAAKRLVTFEAAMDGRLGAPPAPPPTGHTRVVELLATAADAARNGRAAGRAAAEQFTRAANAALAG